MYQFSRAVRLVPGDVREQLAWAYRITEKVNQISEVPVLLWSSAMSPRVGTLAWSASVSHLGIIESVDDKLSADESYLSLYAEGARHVSSDGLTDHLVRTVHMSGEIDPTHLQYVTSTTMLAKAGNTAAAFEFAVEIAKMCTDITGCACTVGTVMTGPQTTLQLASYFGSIDEMERADDAIRSSQAFMERVDRQGSRVITDGSAETVIVRKLA
jgi:hypothetical protein